MSGGLDGSAVSLAARRDGPSFDLVAVASPHESTQRIIQSGSSARIDVSDTFFRRVLSRSADCRLRSASSIWYSIAAVCFWLGQCVIIVVIPLLDKYSDSIVVREAVAYAGALLSLPALTLSTGYLNVGMVRMLVYDCEFLRSLLLNTIQWTAVAMAFRFDCRSGVCAVEWWVVQLTLTTDADCRLCAQRFHTAIAACLATFTYFSWLLSGFLHRSSQPMVAINSQTTSVNDLLQWTAPTLCLIMMKNVYYREIRRREVTPARATDKTLVPATVVVYCSTVKTRLTLAKVSDGDSERNLSSRRHDSDHDTPLVRSHTALAHVDGTPLPEQGISLTFFAFFYSLGVVSFIGTCLATFLLQIHVGAQSHSSVAPTITLGSLVGTIFFCGLTARFYHRQLLRQLVRVFDAVVSSVQFCVGSTLLCELYQWDVRTVVVVSWTLWFHWLLCLDALTPPIREYLRLRKLAATPVALFNLYALAGPFVLLYGYTNTHLHDRAVVAGIRISTLLLSRVLTLWLWNVHLVWDLGVRDDREFLFLKDHVQYAVPQGSLVSVSRASSTSANAVAPSLSIGPRLSALIATRVPSTASSSPLPPQ